MTSSNNETQFEKFMPYLESIHITTTALQSRCQLVISLLARMTSERIEDVFVSDYFNADGTREYESLWCFTKNYVLEAKNFITNIELDIMPISKRVTYWTVTAKDFEFQGSNINSRFSLRFSVSLTMRADFKAARENCAYLQAIIEKYVKPNQVAPQGSS